VLRPSQPLTTCAYVDHGDVASALCRQPRHRWSADLGDSSGQSDAHL